MSKAVATIEHIRGETITYGLRSDPSYDGTEVVTCDIKQAYNSSAVPADSATVVMSPTPVFVAVDGAVAAHWLFTITAAQSADIEGGNYITDAMVIYSDGSVDYPKPLGIVIARRVTK